MTAPKLPATFDLVNELIIDEFNILNDIQNKVDELIGERNCILYRGEPKDFGCTALLPNIFRNDKLLQNTNFENKLISHFQDLYRNKSFQTESGLVELNELTLMDKLILMQHYGFPTRLLDWSLELKVALYFCCSKNINEDGFIYILPPSLTYKGEDGRDRDPLNAFTDSNIFFHSQLALTENAEAAQIKFWNEKTPNLIQKIHMVPYCTIHNPKLVFFDRMKMQASVFTFHLGYLERSANENEYNYRVAPTIISGKFIQHKIWRICIKSHFKLAILNHLRNQHRFDTSRIYPEPVYDETIEFMDMESLSV